MLNVPPTEEMPEPFRGRTIVVVDGAVLGDDESAATILAPLRELGPDLDTFEPAPAASLVRMHMDPEGPTPAVSDAAVLCALPAEAVAAFTESAGPGSGSSLVVAELRQLGGALGRSHPGAGALPRIEGRFALFCAAVAATPEMAAQGEADATRVVEALWPWANGRHYLNFAEHEVDMSSGFDGADFARLQRIRAAVDPDGVLVANHRIPLTATVPQPRS